MYILGIGPESLPTTERVDYIFYVASSFFVFNKSENEKEAGVESLFGLSIGNMCRNFAIYKGREALCLFRGI